MECIVCPVLLMRALGLHDYPVHWDNSKYRAYLIHHRSWCKWRLFMKWFGGYWSMFNLEWSRMVQNEIRFALNMSGADWTKGRSKNRCSVSEHAVRPEQLCLRWLKSTTSFHNLELRNDTHCNANTDCSFSFRFFSHLFAVLLSVLKQYCPS